MVVDLGWNDVLTAVNLLVVNGGWLASELTTVTVLGGPGRDTLLHNGPSLLLPGRGSYSFQGAGGIDMVHVVGNVNWTLNNALVRSSIGGQILLSSIEQGTLVGGAGNNLLNATNFTGTTFLTGGRGNDDIRGGRGFNWLVETSNVNFVLTNARLTGLGTDRLIRIQSARLIGGPSNNNINAQAFSGRTYLSGGAGNDVLRAGAGPSILMGGPGNDTLFGGRSRDLLIGGLGADSLNGGGGDDLLIGGTTIHDASWDALEIVLNEWNRGATYL